MSQVKLLAIVAVVALASIACNFTVNTPVRNISIGSLETYEFNVPQPEAGESSEVDIKFGAGELFISPSDSDALISGEAEYNVEEFEPKVTVRGTEVEISQEINEFNIIPIRGEDLKNTWDLKLGNYPMALQIAAGAYRGEYNLGGLALSDLHIAEGAADTRLDFSEANPIVMESLRFETGASQAALTGLANANFEKMEFRSGAGDYRLEFTGDLMRDGEVEIKSGLGNLVLVVPEGTAATVEVSSGLTNINVSGDWRSRGGEYSLEGEGPQLVITVEMGAGNLELRER